MFLPLPWLIKIPSGLVVSEGELSARGPPSLGCTAAHTKVPYYRFGKRVLLLLWQNKEWDLTSHFAGLMLPRENTSVICANASRNADP